MVILNVARKPKCVGTPSLKATQLALNTNLLAVNQVTFRARIAARSTRLVFSLCLNYFY